MMEKGRIEFNDPTFRECPYAKFINANCHRCEKPHDECNCKPFIGDDRVNRDMCVERGKK